LSHIPRAAPAEQERAIEPERAAEQEEQPEEEEEEEYEETITLRASNFVAFQDILEDMRPQITDL
jgi:ribosomal protein L12E/L44/L45/RPP1/RPP2